MLKSLCYHRFIKLASINSIKRGFATSKATVFVGNLPFSTTEAFFDSYVKSLGVVGHISRIVMSNKYPPTCRGFGYLDFNSAEEATKAVEQLSGAKLSGKELRVDIDTGIIKAASGIPSGVHSVFISQFGFEATKEDLKSFIERAMGKVPMKIRLTKREDGSSKGFGHIDFSCKEDADRAVEKLKREIFKSRPLYVERSAPKEYEKPARANSSAPARSSSPKQSKYDDF